MIISKKTVFVLGAGASAHFGFPTGKELKEIICSNELNTLETARLMVDADAEDDVIVDMEKRIVTFKENFSKSGDYSIDSFLKKNPRLSNIGKKLIAAALFPKEKEDFLFVEREGGNWYLQFWNMVDKTFENIDKHEVHFITFNYDRSLEHFLLKTLFHSYSQQKSIEECARKIMAIDIVHVNGRLAPLPWQGKENGHEYNGRPANRTGLKNAVKNLFVIGEKTQENVLKQIKSEMEKAKYIYFLGFGFDEENLEILGDYFGNANLVWGTALHLGDVLKNRVEETIIKNKKVQMSDYMVRHKGERRVRLYNESITSFLSEHIYLE